MTVDKTTNLLVNLIDLNNEDSIFYLLIINLYSRHINYFDLLLCSTCTDPKYFIYVTYTSTRFWSTSNDIDSITNNFNCYSMACCWHWFKYSPCILFCIVHFINIKSISKMGCFVSTSNDIYLVINYC